MCNAQQLLTVLSGRMQFYFQCSVRWARGLTKIKVNPRLIYDGVLVKINAGILVVIYWLNHFLPIFRLS